MNTSNIERLNKTFSISNNDTSLKFTMGEGNIPIVEIENTQAKAVISLQGAHLLSWVPTNQNDIIWLSKEATFKLGKSVRGGIPICWPWFGAHETEKTFPAHGFARTVLWQVLDTKSLATGETQITFYLQTNQLTKELQKMWPNDTSAEYQLTIGSKLKLELITKNESEVPIVLGQALHTYFNVNDVSKTCVKGLENTTYLDKPDDFKSKTQVGDITFNEEVDRVYLHTLNDVVIDNKIRKIKIEKKGSESTVVWNPWKEVAEKMGDLGEKGYLEMLCVESANAADDTVVINAGNSHCLSVVYSV